MSKHPTEETKAVKSQIRFLKQVSKKSSGALRLSDNETYSSRTTHARCHKAGKGKLLCAP